MSRKKPSDYRERLSYVNLEPKGAAILIYYSSNCYDLRAVPSGQGPDPLLNLRLICFIWYNFRPQKQRRGGWALMRRRPRSFAVFNPAFWGQEDEDENNQA